MGNSEKYGGGDVESFAEFGDVGFVQVALLVQDFGDVRGVKATFSPWGTRAGAWIALQSHGD